MKRFRYILPEKEPRKHLVVSQEMHLFVSVFAHENDITITEATFRLLRIALGEVYRLRHED